MTERRPLERRTVLGGAAAAGLALVAVPAVTSCSSGSPTGGGTTTTKVQTSQVPVGGGVIESATGVVVVQPTEIDAFNLASYNAIMGSSPTEPLPPEYPDDRAFFTVTFSYNEPVN